MSKEPRFKALLKGKCPKCHKGNFFVYPFYKVLHFDKCNIRCSHCNHKFEPEPGFFTGSMYMSYAISVAIIVIGAISLNFIFNDPAVEVYFAVILTAVVALFPFTFRAARMVYMYLFSGAEYDERL